MKPSLAIGLLAAVLVARLGAEIAAGPPAPAGEPRAAVAAVASAAQPAAAQPGAYAGSDEAAYKKLAATLSYLYEPFRVYDLAFDPSVVNSIVQPSSLVLGYVYRPYTANTFNFGVRYLW